jgi:lipopolysaccharide O-acetyltransferase
MNNSVRKVAQQYSLGGMLRLLLDVLYTKVFVCSKARVIRRPAYIRGSKFIDYGNGLTTGVAVRLDAFESQVTKGATLIFGNNVQLNDYVHIGAVQEVRIGNNVLIASKVFISDHGHGRYGDGSVHDSPDIPPASRPLKVSPVIIEDNVWIGELVSILPGVKIGYGSVIGAGSIVTKDIASRSVAVGSPAKVIRSYNDKTKKWIKV